MAIYAKGLSASTFQRVMELPGFPDQASFQESFRLRAWELHPDVSLLPDSQLRFQELYSFFQGASGAPAGNPWNPRIWNDAKSLEKEFESLDDSRLASGLVRRIAFLEEWDSLPFLFRVLEEGKPALLWAAIHALIRLEARSAASLLHSGYEDMPLGLRCAVLRYARSTDRAGTGKLASLLMDDSEIAIRGPARSFWDMKVCPKRPA